MTRASRCSASDAASLIGIPWAAGAQGPDAYDCWAAAGMIQRRFFGRALPGLGPERARDVASARRAWRLARRPAEGDLVEMRRGGRANHVGVWMLGGVLHCQQGAGICHDTLEAIRLSGWRPRFWTPSADALAPSPAEAVAIYVPGLDLLLGADDPDALLAAHRAVPLAARAGDSVAQVLARAGLDTGGVAVFLRAGGAGPVELPRDPSPDRLAAVLSELGALDAATWPARRLAPGERMVVMQVPHGRGSNPLAVVLSVVVLAAAAFIAGPAGLGLGAQFTGVAGAFGLSGGQLVFGAVSLLGRLAISALLPPPSPGGLGRLTEDISPTFSAQAQSSVARPGAPVPVQFGRHIHLLDDVAPPWVRFENNRQIIHQLLALGIGEHQLEEVRLGDVAAWRDGMPTGNLPGVEVEHVLAGQPVTLFDEAVWTQRDVSGLELQPGISIGWHAAVPKGRKALAVEIDIAFRQLVRIGDSGANNPTTVDIRVEAQQIDDSDAALGDPFQLEVLSFTDATRSELRSSHRWFLPEGRYRLRATRLTPAGGENTFDDAFWAGLKGVLPGGRTYDGMELLAVRVEVGEQFAAQSARAVSAIKTRKLPVWDGAAWTAPQPTREIAWAVAEILRMHGRLGDIDLDDLLALHQTWAARGDRFDTVFDQSLSFWEALQAALRAGRAQPDQAGRRLRIWRDEPSVIPRQLFSERNLRRGSVVIRPILPLSERPERLVAQFMDETTWRLSELAVGAFTGRERRERYFGITDRAHLAREVSHDLRAARLRSVRVEFEAELEARLLRRGDPIALSHRELTQGLSLAIEDWQGQTVIFDRPVDWASVGDAPVLLLSAPDGSVWGPVNLVPPVELNAAEAFVAAAETDQVSAQTGHDPRVFARRGRARDEPIRAVLGAAQTVLRRLIVEHVGQERGGFSPVTAIDDDPAAHDAPVQPGGTLDGAITGLAGSVELVDGNSQLLVDVAVAPEFDASPLSFVFEWSDDGIVWLPLAEGSESSIALPPPPGVAQVRAAAVLGSRGPWVTAPVAGSGLSAPASLAETAPGTYAGSFDLGVTGAAVTGAASYRFELSEDGAGVLIATLSRSAPLLTLSRDDLGALGGLVRAIRILLRAVDATGATGPGAEIVLANPAPTGLVLANPNLLVWNSAPEPDVTGWQVTASWLGAPVTTSTPQFGWSEFQSGTVTVRAMDAAGTGPGSAMQRVADPFNPQI